MEFKIPDRKCLAKALLHPQNRNSLDLTQERKRKEGKGREGKEKEGKGKEEKYNIESTNRKHRPANLKTISRGNSIFSIQVFPSGQYQNYIRP
jgi:hypothetical protein